MPKSSPCLMEFIKLFSSSISGSTVNNFEANVIKIEKTALRAKKLIKDFWSSIKIIVFSV